MTILHISGGDIESIEKFIAIGREEFNLTINVLDDVEITSESIDIDKKTKWAEFAKKMDGLFTPDIIRHIEASRKN